VIWLLRWLQADQDNADGGSVIRPATGVPESEAVALGCWVGNSSNVIHGLREAEDKQRGCFDSERNSESGCQRQYRSTTMRM
jgi:hypothetical protein